MIVSELILKLQSLPQDATVMLSSHDYPEVVRGASKIGKSNFDGYYYPQFNTNPNVVVKIW